MMYIIQTMLFKQQELEVTVAQERTLPQWQASQGVGFPSKAHVQQSHHIGMCCILNVLFLFLSTHYTQEGVT